MWRGIVLCVLALVLRPDIALSADCEGNPNALGTSRILYVDPAEHPLIGSIQYRETLPLADHEVVITFDDGPARTNTPRVLDILRAECVKATFFMVGAMAKASPALVKRAYDEGHTIASHSQTHPLNLSRLPVETAWTNMIEGHAAVLRALGEGRTMSPFIRFPALNRTKALDAKAMAQGLMVWSADMYADDWLSISPEEVARRPLERLERAGRGVVLFHDIHARTVAALPAFLKSLKARGFKVVHVMPATPAQAKTDTVAANWHALDRRTLGLPAHMLQAGTEN